MLYSTTYNDGFFNLIEAPNDEQATRILLARHLGERPFKRGVLEGAAPPNAYTEPLAPRRENGRAIHQAVFLAYVGLKAGVLTLEETVGDNGLAHQLAHDLHFGDREPHLIMPRYRMEAMYNDQRRRVPGWPQLGWEVRTNDAL